MIILHVPGQLLALSSGKDGTGPHSALSNAPLNQSAFENMRARLLTSGRTFTHRFLMKFWKNFTEI